MGRERHEADWKSLRNGGGGAMKMATGRTQIIKLRFIPMTIYHRVINSDLGKESNYLGEVPESDVE